MVMRMIHYTTQGKYRVPKPVPFLAMIRQSKNIDITIKKLKRLQACLNGIDPGV